MSVKYIKNIQVSKRYGVSRPTAGKWLENAIERKNNLQLAEVNGRWYILDNKHNAAELSRLKEKGVKYRNKIGYECVEPREEFYTIFSPQQIIDILSHLEFNHQIPMKYAYLNGGAHFWNKYILEAEKENPKYISETTELIESNIEYLVYQLTRFNKVNIFELGPGNGITSKKIIESVHQNGLTSTYNAIDISSEMNGILQNNMASWFPNVPFREITEDFESLSLQEHLFTTTIDEKSCNLIILVGGTIGNYYDRVEFLKRIRSYMGSRDFLLIDNVMDKVEMRTSFTSLQNSNYIKLFKWIPEVMGIRSDMYEQVFKYDVPTLSRQFLIKLIKDVDISLIINEQEKIISLPEGIEIDVWHHHAWQYETLLEEFDAAGLNHLHFSINRELDNALVFSMRSRKKD